MLIYCLSSTGMTLNVHYCCGKIKKVDWVSSPEKKCGNEYKMGSMPCCQNKQVTLKPVSDYFKNDILIKDGKTFFLDIFPCQSVIEKILFKENKNTISFPLPLTNSPPLFLLNKVFKI